jgi:hypothetical protein
LISLLGRERPAGEDDFLCPALAHCTRQVLGSSGPRHDANRYFCQRETRATRRVDEVAAERDLVCWLRAISIARA